jgi:hypothetical protein
VFDRFLAQTQGRGDLLIRHPLRQVLQNFVPARRQGRKQRTGRLTINN